MYIDCWTMKESHWESLRSAPRNWKKLNVKHNSDNSISCDKIFTTNWVSYNIIDYE